MYAFLFFFFSIILNLGILFNRFKRVTSGRFCLLLPPPSPSELLLCVSIFFAYYFLNYKHLLQCIDRNSHYCCSKRIIYNIASQTNGVQKLRDRFYLCSVQRTLTLKLHYPYYDAVKCIHTRTIKLRM